jgi:hypothetical protein
MGLVVAPFDVDITLYQGASWVESFHWKMGETTESATGVDLTDATLIAEIRESPDAYLVLARASSADGTITADAEGNIEIRVPGDDVAVGLDLTRGYRHLEVHWLDGDVCRIVQGRVVISREIVKDD